MKVLVTVDGIGDLEYPTLNRPAADALAYRFAREGVWTAPTARG